MDHSKNQKLRNDVQKNRDREKVANGGQSPANEYRAIRRAKQKILKECRSAGAGVLDAVA
jgi:hypothetical protein